MFDFLNRRKADRGPRADRRRIRSPMTIGFEQLEDREMLSSGKALSIIPSQPSPLMKMPRPIVGCFDPEATRAFTVSVGTRPGPKKTAPKPRLWPLGGRFRMD